MNNFIQSIKNLSPGRLASIAAIVIFLISFFVYLAIKLNTGDYAVLYTDLEMEDAKQIGPASGNRQHQISIDKKRHGDSGAGRRRQQNAH